MRVFTIIDVAAALVVALTLSAAPAVQAAKNDSRFERSVEAKKKHLQACADLKLVYEGLEDAAEEEASVGAPRAAEKYGKAANTAWADGKKLGCSWAQ
jgi:hypothetical protein